MQEEGNVLLKVYLQNDVNSTKEIRRFRVVANNYISFREKLVTLFDDLNEQVAFGIYWKDSEGDNIKISTDEELLLALNEQNCDVNKIYIIIPHVIDQGPEQLPNSSTTVNEILHPHVVCDGCGQHIRGFRYKCLQCDDYDLCGNCEGRRTHSQHLLLRIPLPVNTPLLRCLSGSLRRCRRSGIYNNNILTDILARPEEGVQVVSDEVQHFSLQESSNLLHGAAGVCDGVATDVGQLAKYLETLVASNSANSSAEDTQGPTNESNDTIGEPNEQLRREETSTDIRQSEETDSRNTVALFEEQLTQLYEMGFEDTNGYLSEILHMYEGNMDNTLNHLFNQ